MKLIDLTINEFLHEVDAATPAPGGGSVSALSVAEGLSLLGMVAHLTISKKKFQNLEQKVQKAYLENLEKLKTLKIEVLALVDEDTAAFNAILAGFRLPKDTPILEKERENAIYQATQVATQVPYQTVEIAHQALSIAVLMLPYAIKSAASDFGVGTLMIYSGLEGACLNVQTNISGLTSSEKDFYQEKIEEKLSLCKEIKEEVLQKVQKAFL